MTAIAVPNSFPAQSFSTPHPEDAQRRTEIILGCSHEMGVVRRPEKFNAEISYLPISQFGLFSGTYGAAISISCRPPIPWITVSYILGGQAQFCIDGTEPVTANSGDAIVLDYARPLTVTLQPGVEHKMVTLSKVRTEAFVQQLLGRQQGEPLRFDTRMDSGSGSGRFQANMLAAVEIASNLQGAGPIPALASELERSLISALVLGQRSNYWERLMAPASCASPRVVDRVMEYIDASTDHLTIADLASFAQVSERALYAAFKRQVGITPMTYLRKSRLDRAHKDLTGGMPPYLPTVTDVAYKHGFSNVGRFAAYYKAAFGEFPSDSRRGS